jgi:opacity protein-like surface antigen
MKLKSTLLGAVAALALTSSAFAAVVNPPGERAGIDFASPLPEGVYFVDMAGVGNNRGSYSNASNFDYNVPVIAWSTPWTILGGRIQLIAAAPALSVAAPVSYPHQPNGVYARGIYNPFVAGQIAFNLGNGFSASYLAGAYIAVDSPNSGGAWNQTTFHQMLALAYHGGGWNATANLMYGIVGDNNTSGLQNSNYFNYDLGLTHTFGKWEVGVIAYGSVNGQINGYYHNAVYQPYTAGNSMFAVGGLIGYNFGPVIMQFSLSTDVASNYPSKATFAGLHVIIPIWNPEEPKAVVAKY